MYGVLGGFAGFLGSFIVRCLADSNLKTNITSMMERKTNNQQSDDIRPTNIYDYCQNCNHRKFDPQRGIVCGLTDDKGDFWYDCERFEPSETYIARKRAEKETQQTAKENSEGLKIGFVAGGILVYLWCLISQLWSDDNFPATIWVLLAAGVTLAGAGAVYYFYCRSQLKKITFGRLTRKKILNMLRVEGYVPHIDEDGDIQFKADGHRCYIQYQDQNPRFILRADWACQKERIALMRAFAEQVMREFVVVKVLVSDYIEERQSAVISISVEALISYEAEMSERLSDFIRIIEAARYRLSEMRQKYEAEQSALQEVLSLRRRDIYNKEYREIPAIVDGVTDGKYKPEALWDDESGLRGYLRRDCDPSMQAEWDAFRIVRVDNYGDYKLIIYQFPDPKEVPEALYGAVLLDTKTHRAEYYTLEYSYNDKWVYGSTSRGKHFNYGETNTPNLELFVAWILSSDKKLLHYTDLNSNDNETVN